MAKNCASGILAAAAYASFGVDHAYADGPFKISSFATSPAAPTTQQPAPEPDKTPAQPTRNDNPRTSSAGFDPEALERGVKALKEISSSSHAKKVFEVIKKQEETKQQELAAKAAEFRALQSHAEAQPTSSVLPSSNK